MKYIIKIFFRSVLFISAILLLYNFILSFVISPCYKFSANTKFSGEVIYNPYENLISDEWIKANFHAHTNVFGGITDGRNNSASELWSTYKKLDYNLVGISDYMSINNTFKSDDYFIPIYEHGYNLRKIHQLAIGARNVTWLDFPLFQTLDNKQFIIDQLQETSEIVAIAHPSKSEAYTPEELTLLNNYSHIEVFTSMHSSTAHWDSLLSNGKSIFALGNDDCHDLSIPNHYGFAATLICADEPNSESVITALKKGSSMVLVPIREYDDNLQKKIDRLWATKDIKLTQCDIRNDSIFISLNKEISNIKIYGQGGKVISQLNPNSMTIATDIGSNWTYLRTEIELQYGDKLFLNPIFKTNKGLNNRNTAVPDPTKTIIFRTISLIVILLSIFSIYKMFNFESLSGRKKQ